MRHFKLILCLMLCLIANNVSAQKKNNRTAPTQTGNKKFALLVGISEYQLGSGFNNIHGANDVDLLSTTLKGQNFNVETLTNDSATAENIRNKIKSLQDRCKNAEVVFVLFSGHGQPVEDVNGWPNKTYSKVDEHDGWDESFVAFDASYSRVNGEYEGQNHITDDEIHEMIDGLRKSVGEKGLVVFALDACYGGGAERGGVNNKPAVRGTKNGFSKSGKTFKAKTETNIKPKSIKGYSDYLFLAPCLNYQMDHEIQVGNSIYGCLSYYLNSRLKNLQKGVTMNKTNIENIAENVQGKINSGKNTQNQNMRIIKCIRK